MPRPQRSTPKIRRRAVELRKEPTPAEARLWASLRGNKLNGINIKRPHAIGNYVVDFCSIKKKLVIELDGSQHLEQEEYDIQCTEFLESRGYKVLRFWNNEVLKNIDDVIHEIQLTHNNE